ncbi:DNA polymerase III subunit delta [Sandaracinobacteroides hominis]|uniref:DNA polymerase III subunit delta n=1 Tax=Sandaracinobacteroides hominis TaxID=2780086 RepID=UPI0018F61853|nr:DNA polymerase III subunit delta [Sandaracinobacteroides hominis]
MTAVKRADIQRALARWDGSHRLLLFHGKGEGESAELAREALKALADPADPMAVTQFSNEELRSDPGKLADEAASVSMFGGRRVIRVEGATDFATPAVKLLLESAAAGNPVVIVAGDLSRTSSLRALADQSPLALAVLSYEPDARSMGAMLADRAREQGLRIEPAAAQRLIALSDNDPRILSAELEKFAIYLGATPAKPKTLDRTHLALLGADSAEEDMNALVFAVVTGDRRAAERQLRLLNGTSSIPALRALSRKLMQLADARSAVDGGASPQAAVKGLRPPVFWKEADAFAAALSDWPMRRIRAAQAAMLEGERAIKTAGGPGEPAGWQAIVRLGMGAESA